MKPLNEYPTPLTEAHMKTLPYAWDYFDHETLRKMGEIEQRLAACREALGTLINESLVMERDHQSNTERWFERIEAPSAQAVARARDTLNLTK